MRINIVDARIFSNNYDDVIDIFVDTRQFWKKDC